MKTIYYIASVLVLVSILTSCTAEEMPQSQKDQIANLMATPIDPPIIADRPK